MTSPALHVEGLSKRYGRIEALRPMSIDIPHGAVFALLGSNGAGKSTFMKAVLTLVRPDSGTVLIDGVDSRDPSSRRSVRYLPEIIRFPGMLTPLALHAMLSDVRECGTPGELRERCGQLSCEELLERPFSKMSRGQVQRSAIAMAFAGDPGILFLDEPSNGLDPEARIALRTMVRDAASRGATIVLNSHLLGEVEAVCRMAAFMRKGAIVASGEFSSLVKHTGRARIETVEPGRMSEFLVAAGSEVFVCDGGVEASVVENAFPALVSAVASSGIPFTSVELRSESLEDLFMRLAGAGSE